MKQIKKAFLCSIACAMVITFLPMTGWAEDLPHPSTYIPTYAEILKHKEHYDDPRPYMKTFGMKQVLPPDLYEKLTYDVEEMKEKWAEAVGFRSPDVVGKIAPEIKPGKYSYKDKEKYPGLKELMWPEMYKRINPGGPPHAGNMPEFEIVPTRQYYYGLPIAECTLANEGKAKLDGDGYLQTETWDGGFPFPKPSGELKAQEIMYDVEKRYLSWGLNFFIVGWIDGYTKDLKRDFVGLYDVSHIRLAGRCLMPPYGWFDSRAKTRGEFKTFVLGFLGPRDVVGTAQQGLAYLDPTTMDQNMVYIPSLRRIRRLSATDSQDPIMGQDLIYDDNEGFQQKLSPTRYPYDYEIVEEREFLLPAYAWDGSEYISSEGIEFRNMTMERRPMYVVQLTQKDPNYVYSSRIFYIDKETFNYHYIENYDHKGRLYRSLDGCYGFIPEMGAYGWAGAMLLMKDHIDLHSGVQQPYQVPAFWNREDVSMRGLVVKGK